MPYLAFIMSTMAGNTSGLSKASKRNKNTKTHAIHKGSGYLQVSGKLYLSFLLQGIDKPANFRMFMGIL